MYGRFAVVHLTSSIRISWAIRPSEADTSPGQFTADVLQPETSVWLCIGSR